METLPIFIHSSEASATSLGFATYGLFPYQIKKEFQVIDKNDNSRLVFSSEQGRICPQCKQPVNQCQCKKKVTAPAYSDEFVRIRRETKGRKGKGVTLICGLPLPEEELKNLAKALKQKCGTGGTVKTGTIEIQGDHRERLLEVLQKQGWKVKLAGG